MKQFYAIIISVLVTFTVSFAQTTDLVTGLVLPKGLILKDQTFYFNTGGFNRIEKVNLNNNPLIVEAVTPNFSVGGARGGFVFYGDELYFNTNSKIEKTNIADAFPVVTDVISVGCTDIAIRGDILYMTASQKIYTIDLTEMSPMLTELTYSDTVGYGMFPVAITIEGDNLYFSEINTDKIRKIDLSQPVPVLTDFVTGLNDPEWMTIDFLGDYLYYTGFESGSYNISRINLNESTPVQELIIDGLAIIQGLDVFTDQLTFIEGGSVNRIAQFNLSSLSIDEAKLEDKNIKVFPNPSSDYINVSGLKTTKERYGIYDISGKKVIAGEISTNENVIDVHQLENGLYFLRFDGGESQKFIKNN